MYTPDPTRVRGSRDVPEPAEEVALALGSNLGDRLCHLRAALRELSALAAQVLSVSSVYETAAEGDPGGGPYLNAAAICRTSVGPAELLSIAKAIERDRGRQLGARNAARQLDIDIVFFGRRTIDLPGLTIPHPRWTERLFVLAPLSEVAGDWCDPVSGRRVDEVLRGGTWNRSGVTRVLPPDALLSVLPEDRGPGSGPG